MSYYTSLTGLQAAATNLSVTSNNIANVGTTGFKKSRAEFGDIVATSAAQMRDAPGLGTSLRGLTQQFTQGSFASTGETLNMAISGQGFFVTRQGPGGGAALLTRDGAFGPDDQGYVTDGSGGYLQVMAPGAATASLDGLTALRVPQANGTAKATATLAQSVTLPADATVPTRPFDPADPASYNAQTSTTVYDASGNPRQAATYFVRTAAPTAADPASAWTAHLVVDGQEATGTAALAFDGAGALAGPAGPTAFALASGGSLAVDFGAATRQAGSAFALTATSQDGVGVGRLSGLSVGTDGIVAASYSDGSTTALGRVALANVADPAGLQAAGDSKWTATPASGAVTLAGADSGGMGLVKSGQLEAANVDITEELVQLIQAQRNFQANAKAIDTANQITEIAVNLRG